MKKFLFESWKDKSTSHIRSHDAKADELSYVNAMHSVAEAMLKSRSLKHCITIFE